MTSKQKKKKPTIPDPFSTSNVLFFKMPLIFQTHQSSMHQSEKDIYTFFMIQVKYKKSLSIETSVENISYWTGIKSTSTINTAIKGLAEKGWIGNIIYQMQKPNIYMLNLKPVVNKELLEKIKRRSENTSKAKKASIKDGETGKFKTGDME